MKSRSGRRAVALSAAALLLAAPSAAAEVTTITHMTYSYHGDAYHAYIQAAVKAFEALHPDIKVDVIIGDQNKLSTMIAAGAAPDVADLPDFEYLITQGGFVDQLPLMKRDNLVGNYSPAVIEHATSSDGGLYITPLEFSSRPVYFNRSLFDAAGLTTPDQMGDDWNWDYVLQAGKKLTIDRNGDGTPEQFGVDRPWGTWQFAVYQAGGAFYKFDPETKQPTAALWTSQPVIDGVSFINQIYQTGITPAMHVAKEADYDFWTGKTAMDLVDGLGIIGAYLAGKVDFDWDFALQPMGPENRAPGGGSAGPYIFKSTKHLDAAWQWVKFYAMTQANVEQFTHLTGRLPALSAAQPAFAALLHIEDKHYDKIFEQAAQAIPLAYAVPPALSPRKIDMDPIWSGKESVKTHLEQIQLQTSAAIAGLAKQ